ncbi:MAG: hypothetical protein ACR2NN_13140 [Bryobacteraceae bacterium]
MRWFFAAPSLLLICGFVCAAEPVQALRFEGLWKLNGPDPARSKLDFQVNGDAITATYYHPYPSALSDIQIDGDRFTASYLDEFASRRTVTGQLKGSRLELTLGPLDSRDSVSYSGSRIAPQQARGMRQQVGGSFNTSGKSASGEFVLNGHSIVFSGGMEGNCVSGSVGADGKGASMNGCLSISKSKP